MNILTLFDIYFVLLVVSQGLINIFVDNKKFKKAGMTKTAKQIKIIGMGSIFIALILYIISKCI